MKIIIAGSRNISDGFALSSVMREAGYILKENIDEIVSGGARGVDRLGEVYAKEQGITIKRFPADWEQYGKAAGYIRNAEMAEYADALVVLWDGQSKGTLHMINTAAKKGMPVFIKVLT